MGLKRPFLHPDPDCVAQAEWNDEEDSQDMPESKAQAKKTYDAACICRIAYDAVESCLYQMLSSCRLYGQGKRPFQRENGSVADDDTQSSQYVPLSAGVLDCFPG